MKKGLITASFLFLVIILIVSITIVIVYIVFFSDFGISAKDWVVNGVSNIFGDFFG